MTNVRLYLDVDGVVNVFPKPNQNKTGWEKLVRAKIEPFVITWSPEMIQALKDSGLDLVWTTMWMEHAPKYLAPVLDFGREARYLVPLGEGQPQWPTIDWKFKSVRVDQMETPGPFVWIDDEMGRDQRLWAESVGGLAIRTNETQGITPEIIARIQEYIATNTDEPVKDEESV